MANKPIAESIRDIANSTKEKTQGQGPVTYVDIIGKRVTVQVSAGSAPLEFTIPNHIDATAIAIGAIAQVDIAGKILTGIINGQNTATETMRSQRTIIQMQQDIYNLQLRIAALEKIIRNGDTSAALDSSLRRMFTAGAGNMTGEDR